MLPTRVLIDEESYDNLLETFRNTFNTCWYGINLGEEIVSDYISFCQNRNHFKPQNWEISNRQFRSDSELKKYMYPSILDTEEHYQIQEHL